MSDNFDPQAVENRRSDLIAKKDWRVIAAVIAALGLAAWPAYNYLLGQVNTTLCKKSLRKIADATNNYVADNDDRLPFAYESAGYLSKDVNLRAGYAYSWQWQLNDYVNDWEVFKCHAARDGEDTKTSDGTAIHESSYGMLSGYGGLQLSTISNPADRFFISETAKNGASGTVDPLGIRTRGTALTEDGFVIGFDNDQEYPNLATKSATRLAFPDSSKYGFTSETDTRHPGGNHFLYIDGHVRRINAEAAKVSSLSGAFGSWDVPKTPALLGQPSLKR